MRKIGTILLLTALIVSCGVPKEEFEALQAKADKTAKKLNEAKNQLAQSNEENVALNARLKALNEQQALLKANTQVLVDNMGNLSLLTKKGAENLEKSLESLREKDNRIASLQDALSLKDSVTFALVSSIKGSLGDMADEDISVNIDKGVVFISIADNLLFRSGSYKISGKAKPILAKVAKIVKAKSDFEFIVEGHTDNVSINLPGIRDNWDLSVLRSTSIVRSLHKDFDVDPTKMTAAGRSKFINISENDTKEGRSRNRRIKIIIIPKLDQFFTMIEESLQ